MRIRVKNDGNANASGVYVRDICPAKLICTSYTYNGQTSTISNNTLITPNLAPLNGLVPGASIELIVNGTVNANASNETITNVACVDTMNDFSSVGSSNPVTATLP